MSEVVQIVTTTGSEAEAAALAAALVQRRLAACAQVAGPVQSTYRWQGKVETAQEWLCIVKTSQPLYAEVERAICELHSYDTPEILAFDVAHGSADYIAWLHEQLRPGDQV